MHSGTFGAARLALSVGYNLRLPLLFSMLGRCDATLNSHVWEKYLSSGDRHVRGYPFRLFRALENFSTDLHPHLFSSSGQFVMICILLRISNICGGAFFFFLLHFKPKVRGVLEMEQPPLGGTARVHKWQRRQAFMPERVDLFCPHKCNLPSECVHPSQ